MSYWFLAIGNFGVSAFLCVYFTLKGEPMTPFEILVMNANFSVGVACFYQWVNREDRL